MTVDPEELNNDKQVLIKATLTDVLTKSLMELHTKGALTSVTSFLFDEVLKGLVNIDEQNLEELQRNLLNIDGIMKQVDISIYNSDKTAQKIILLENKTKILDRILKLQSEEEIKKITDEAGNQPHLQESIKVLISKNNDIQNQMVKIEELKEELQEKYIKQNEEIISKKAEREAFKERWTIWRSFVEKESVSTIVGALLLVIIVVSLITATFIHVITPQILDNGFLVLLGYFFGQTTVKPLAKQKEEN